MPGSYAHFSMGCKCLEQLPSDIKEKILPFKNIFYTGLRGPDMFFYYYPVFPNRVNFSGYRMHGKSPAEFIGRGKALIGKEKDKRAKYMMFAYMCGFLCHYYLDRECHRYIKRHKSYISFYHYRIERELDRRLYLRDRRMGELWDYDDYKIIPTKKMCAVISDFFQGISPNVIAASVRGHNFYCRINQTYENTRRKIIKYIRKRLRSKNGCSPDSLCISCDVDALVKLYDISVRESVQGIISAEEYIFGSSSLPPFPTNFKGVRSEE